MTETGPSRLVGVVLVAAMCCLLLGVLMTSGLATADEHEQRSLDALADEAQAQYDATTNAVRFASLPLYPALLGGGLGIGIGAIGGAVFAYQNRGMR